MKPNHKSFIHYAIESTIYLLLIMLFIMPSAYLTVSFTDKHYSDNSIFLNSNTDSTLSGDSITKQQIEKDSKVILK